MKKSIKKVLCSLLVVVMCLSAAPLQGFVGVDWSWLDFSVKASAVSGSCGPNARWEYYSSTGKLYIYGTGEITYQSSGTKYPWYEYSYTTVDVAEGITKIPSYTFEYCSTVETINLPKSLKYLALNAFNDCSNLNNLVLPDSVVEFTYDCFNRCPKLTDIYYMGTVEEWNKITNASTVWFFPAGQEHTIHYLIDLSTKATCQHGGTEPYYQFDKTDLYGSLYDVNKNIITTPVKVPVQDHSFTKYEPDNNFTCFEDGTKTAYCDYSCGTKNTIIDENSASHTDVQSDNYCDMCGGYIGAVISTGSCGENVIYTLYENGRLFISGEGEMDDYLWDVESPFYCLDDINSVVISDGVTTIGSYAFYGCSELTSITIPDSVTTIGSVAFGSCSLTSITIPDSVTTIGSSAFVGCTSLTSITIPGSVTIIGTSAFSSCMSLTSITIPDSVTTIGASAFAGCSELTSISVDENNKYYSSDSDGVLFNKDKTELIIYPEGITSTTYTIPDSVTSIGEKAFRNCYNLTSITIPDNVTTINFTAFYYCTGLTSITIGSGVTTIDFNAFAGCSELTSISVDENNKYYSSDNDGVLFNKKKTQLIIYPVGIKSATYIIPDSVTSIRNDAFNRCYNLTSITIPDSVTSIGSDTFAYCDNLTSITIPDSVTSIGSYAFNGCINLDNVYYCGIETEWEKIYIGKSNENLTNAIIYYNCCSNNVPDTHNYTSVATAPTCTEKGYTTYACECGESYISNYVDAIGHSHTSEITTKPTHLKEGVETFTCACGDSYTEPVAKLSEHTYVSEITKQPTHKEEGIKTFTCECGDSYVESIAKIPHSYSKTVTAPTCTSKGYTTYTCECGDNYTNNYVDKIPHSYTSKITKQPTHKEYGEKVFTCKCGDSYKEQIAKISHVYSKVLTEPTCTAKGYTTYTCECGDSYVGDYVGTKPHSYNSTVTRPATHLATGIRTYTCKDCGNSYTESIAKTTQHTHIAANVVSPECEKEGYTVYVCECGDSYHGDIRPASGHNYNGDNCSVCGESKVENCGCNCHKGGFSGFIWKILRFFYKLFGINKTCSCGVAHY